MKRTKILMLSIIMMIIVIIAITIVLMSVTKVNNNITDNNITNEVTNNTFQEEYISIENEEKDNKTFQYVNDVSTYFTIQALTNNYVNLIGTKEITRLKNILSPLYVKQYHINDNNILNIANIPKLTNYKQYYKLITSEIMELQVDNDIYVYIVNGKSRIIGKEETFNYSLMIEVDTSKKRYNIYPYNYIKDKGYTTIKIGDTLNDYEIEDITDRDNNSFTYITKSEQDMANQYFDNYHELLIYYKDEAYKKLNSEYSKKRFGSKESFYRYLEDNKIRNATMSIDKYKVVSGDNYTDYVCADKYSNIYIFRQQGGVMRYTVFLDNYTIMSDKDSQAYNNLDKFEKAKYNLSKFIKMVNTKDYNAIYNVLNNTFKNNNFKTVNDLKAYIQNNLYDINGIEIEQYDKDTYKYYVFTCEITNLRNTDESKRMTIIINQTEGTDFTMSFSF